MAANDQDLLQLPAAEAARVLKANVDVGLAHAEVEARRAQYGYNEIPRKKTYPLLQFVKKFWGLSAWMLELILVLSWILGKYTDLYIITALLLVNAVLSFIQEQKASGAIEMLRSKLQVNARVLRDNLWSVLAARELVPGDLIRVRSGDFAPADAKIVSGDLEVDQSALTGESMEVQKGPNGMLYSGSIVRRGEATGIVLSTGTKTYYGRTTELVQMARPKLHAEEVVSRVVRGLFVIVGVLLVVAFVFSLFRHVSLIDMLPLMLVLLLGAVPVALPVMFTVSMALASLQLAKRGVLVTRLSASDDAATMDVLCVDKTGTITLNQLAITSGVPLNGAAESDALLYGALASQEANHDPIDMAFIAAARQRQLFDRNATQVSFTPFDPKTRCTEALVRLNEHDVHIVKGAVTSVAQRCNLSAGAIAKLETQTNELAQKGQRVLAVAVSSDQDALHLVGLVTLSDMPRPDSAKLIIELAKLGVAVKMLTGDALPIAREIAAAVGLGSNLHRAAELEQVAKKDPALAAKIAEESDGFAEIYPEGKYLVVKSLQAGGHVVGMTGDGVNDAPALRQAEVGIAVSSATDVAKSAASVVLTEEGLADIVELITNGRMVYQRIATWIINKISRTILKSAFVVFAYLITGQFVISAFSMILMMFMTDFVKISLSTDNARWSQQPETWDVLALAKIAVVMGLLMVVEAFGLLLIGYRFFGLGANVQALYTFSFETLLYFALFSIFAVRERRHFWDSMPSRTLSLAIGLDMVIGALIVTLGIPGLQPLPLPITLFVFAYAFVFSLVVNDFVKYFVVKKTGINW